MEVDARARNLPLQLANCAFRIPALAGLSCDACPRAALSLATRTDCNLDGLALLGMDAQGDVEMQFAPGALAPEATRRRLAKACQPAEAAHDMIEHAPPPLRGPNRRPSPSVAAS